MKKENLIDDKWSNVRGWKHPDDPYQTVVSYDNQEDESEEVDSKMQYGDNYCDDEESDEEEYEEEESDEDCDRSSDEDYSESESESESELEQEPVETQDESYNIEVDAVRTAVINTWNFIFMALSYISIFYQQNIYPMFKQ